MRQATSTGSTVSQCAGSDDVEAGREIERLDGEAFSLEPLDERRPDPGGAAGDERATRAHGTSTTLPVERRSATRRSASSTSARGNVAPTDGAIAPSDHSSSSSKAAARTTSGRSFMKRPRKKPATVAFRPDEERGVDRLPRSAREADPHDRAERAKQLEAQREEIASHLVEDHVERLELADFLVRDGIRAEGAHVVELLARADRADDLGAERSRGLDPRAADAAGCGGDEDAGSALDPGLPCERDPGRQKGEEKCCSLLVRRLVGKLEHPVLVGDRLLGVAAAVAPDEREHPSAVVRVAGDLRAGNEGERGHLRIPTLADQHVGVVDPRRADAHERLPVARLRRRHLAHLEPPFLVEDDRLHARARQRLW